LEVRQTNAETVFAIWLWPGHTCSDAISVAAATRGAVLATGTGVGDGVAFGVRVRTVGLLEGTGVRTTVCLDAAGSPRRVSGLGDDTVTLVRSCVGCFVGATVKLKLGKSNAGSAVSHAKICNIFI
jgi:hypothetical protein